MSTSPRVVTYLDEIRIKLPTNPATRRLGLAGRVCDVTVGRVHARIHQPTGLVRVKLHEAGIVGDPRTGDLTAPTTGHDDVTDAAAPPLDVGSLVNGLSGCPPYASVVIALTAPADHVHAVASVEAGDPVRFTVGEAVSYSPAHTAVTPTSATIRVADLHRFLSGRDPFTAAVITHRRFAYRIGALALSSSRVVWLLRGGPLPAATRPRLLDRFTRRTA